MIFFEKLFLTLTLLLILLIMLLGVVWLFFWSYLGIKESIAEHKKKMQDYTINE